MGLALFGQGPIIDLLLMAGFSLGVFEDKSGVAIIFAYLFSLAYFYIYKIELGNMKLKGIYFRVFE